ncbi:tetratricopeptide repeat protein, partial [Microscilla marina]|uniref:tetratricopeptide repeat protein n=1 Tax=Microscilla marina TaxID=1027 RepID=UPI0005D479F1
MEHKGNEKLEDFVKKVLNLQKKKETSDEQLSEEDLWEIAQVMGLEAKDLQTAKQNYLTRGKQHLAHQNWQNARKEFEELLTISPKNAEGTFGLALAHEGLWKQKGNDTDKQKAIKLAERVLEVTPSHTQAYELINRMQRPQPGAQANQGFDFDFDELFDQAMRGSHTTSHTHTSTTVVKTSSSSSSKSSRWIFVVLPVIILSVMGYSMRSILFGVPQHNRVQTKATKVVATKDGFVSWVLEEGIVMKGGMSHTYTARIIGHPSGSKLATITIAEGVKITSRLELMRVKDQILVFNADQMILELRDARTGKVTEDLMETIEATPELVKGVGTIAKEGYWFKVTSSTNQVYYYSPYFKTLVTRPDSNLRIEEYLWWTQKTGNATRLSLVKTKISPLRYNTEKKKQTSGINPRTTQQIGQSTQSYIKAKLVYGNEYFCIILHNDKVGKDARQILTAIDRNGEVMWENM